MIEGEEPKYHDEAVEGSRVYRKVLQFRVFLVSWPSPAWEPWCFVKTTEVVACPHARYPDNQDQGTSEPRQLNSNCGY